MELKLTVLAGAKKGTAIPLKKDDFVIGRASDCTLRAGSEAISRRHCVIKRAADGFVVSDLGSRNGTFVNDEQIAGETALKIGDTLRVGPLTFCVEAWLRTAKGSDESTEAQAAASQSTEHEPADVEAAPVATSAGLKKTKQPPVKGVSDVAARLAENGGDSDVMENDISRWLIGTDLGKAANNETVNLNIDETRAMRIDKVTTAPEASDETDDATGDETGDGTANAAAEVDETTGDASAESADVEEEAEGTGSGWSLFSRGKKTKKDAAPERAKPGKLPRVPDKDKAKDSREAAANVLREMTRRR
jgi:pSer/pThr/pTyr-binding forkhead associated (FHA) protein